MRVFEHYDTRAKHDAPYAFIQWKGTDACMDIHCPCGAHLHWDGDFAYMLACPHCDRAWEMPIYLPMRELSAAERSEHGEFVKVIPAEDDDF
jgi:hypothetical protein